MVIYWRVSVIYQKLVDNDGGLTMGNDVGPSLSTSFWQIMDDKGEGQWSDTGS